jgi:hypothetical protein
MVVAPAKARTECDFVSADPGVRVADQGEHTLQVGAALLTGRLTQMRMNLLNGSLPPSALGLQRLRQPNLPHGALVLYRDTAMYRSVEVYLRDRLGREWAITLESQIKRRPTLGAMLNAGVRLLRANVW